MIRRLQQFLLFISLLDRKRVWNDPFYVDLDITNRCNFRCTGCPYHSLENASLQGSVNAHQEMDYDFIVKIFNDLSAMKTREVILLGSGEPMLHPDLIDILEEGKSRAFKLTLLTNGTMLRQKEMVTRLIQAGLDQIKVSLWAMSAADFADYSGVKASMFHEILDGIHCLQMEKIQLRKTLPQTFIHFPISVTSHSKLEDVVKIADTCKVDGVSFSLVYDVAGTSKPLQLQNELLQDLMERLSRLREPLGSKGIKHNIDDMLIRLTYGGSIWDTMPCYVGLYHVKIRVDGMVHPCCRCKYVLGNLHEQSLRDIWRSERYRELRRMTLNRKELSHFATECDCKYCAFVANNFRIHKIDRWLRRI